VNGWKLTYKSKKNFYFDIDEALGPMSGRFRARRHTDTEAVRGLSTHVQYSGDEPNEVGEGVI
jgi:hypothetical protein